MTPSGRRVDEASPRRQLVRAADLVDVLVYVVVLGLAVQFVPSVISESFLVSVITAVLLKIVLELVVAAKNAIMTKIRSAEARGVRAAAAAGLVLLSGASKFAVLWLTDVVLGGAVHLGGFIEVTLLIVVLMLARYAIRAIVR